MRCVPAWLRRTGLLLVLALWPLQPGTAAERSLLPGIEGADDRQPLFEPRPPWTAIGRVNTRTGGFCTGTLVAPDLVLTAAHCLWNRRTGRWLGPQALHFLAGYLRGDYLVHRRVAAVRRAPAVRMDDRGRPLDPGADWAVLTLAAPIGATQADHALRPIPLADAGAARRLREGQAISQAGYSRDRAHMLTVVSDCSLLGLRPTSAGGVMLHDCDATYGDSGSPILAVVDGRLQVVAVHVASVDIGSGRVGMAARAPTAPAAR